MTVKSCAICGEKFEARGTSITCSPEHRKERSKQVYAAWKKLPGWKAKHRIYVARWRSNSGVRDKEREMARAYARSPRAKKLLKARKASDPEGFLSYQREYRKTRRRTDKNYARRERKRSREAHRRRALLVKAAKLHIEKQEFYYAQ